MLKCVEYVFAYVTELRHPCIRSLFYLYTPADGFYAQCFVRVSPGEKVLTMEETPEGYGKEEKFVTLKHDYESFQSAPRFLDDPKVRGCSLSSFIELLCCIHFFWTTAHVSSSMWLNFLIELVHPLAIQALLSNTCI